MPAPPTEFGVRAPSLVDLGTQAAGLVRRAARGQNFVVEWMQACGEPAEAEVESRFEMFLLLPDDGAVVEHQGRRTEAPPRAACLLPAGRSVVRLAAGAACAVLRSLAPGERTDALNEEAYAPPDPRIDAFGAPGIRQVGGDRVRIYMIDELQAPADNPRLKMLRSATMSINWVEYDGPRDRRRLSPHAHRSFEQGSLALAGEFVHHLRVPWTPDATTWVDDRHARLGSPSLMVVPVEMIHTSEGVGPGRHLLVDVFSPPRADFIAKGWMLNAAEYGSSR